MNPDEHDAAPEDDVVDVRPIPPGVAKDMRTLESPPTKGSTGTLAATALYEQATRVLDELEDALYDVLDEDGDVTALGVSEERNAVTGARGLILRRLIHRGRYSKPLAEIFSESGRLDLQGKQRFHLVRDFAYRYHLEVWIHEAVVGDGFVYTAYAIAREEEDSEEFLYLARLIVAPFEIDQWRSTFLETGCGRPS